MCSTILNLMCCAAFVPKITPERNLVEVRGTLYRANEIFTAPACEYFYLGIGRRGFAAMAWHAACYEARRPGNLAAERGAGHLVARCSSRKAQHTLSFLCEIASISTLRS